MHRAPRPRPDAGFTLLELMVVMVIIAVLAGAFAAVGGRLFDQSKNRTRTRLLELVSLVQEYRTIEGDFPSSRLPRNARSNETNATSEALFLAVFDPGYTGTRPEQDWLENTDLDQTTKSLTILATKELFELSDAWGNPIVYFESLHYADTVTVMAGPDGDYFEQQVIPQKNTRTGSWEKPSSFQLISAGEDGEFGTEDDLSNAPRDG